MSGIASHTPLAASVNRITLVDLPSVKVDEGVLGEQAYHLVSVPALIRYAREQAEALELPTALRDADPQMPEVRQSLPLWVDASFNSADPAARHAAESIARRLGRNLGYLLAVLHRGDEVNRAARAEWTAQEWSQWASVRHVWLGGGVVAGALGRQLVTHARSVLAEAGCSALQIERTPYPGHIATLGAARCLPAAHTSTGQRHALVLDLGQTSIKRSVVTFQERTITHVAVLAPHPVPWRWQNSPSAGQNIAGRAVLDLVTEALGTSMEEAASRGWHVDRQVAMSIAAYVEGTRLMGNGIYARMSMLADDVPQLIAEHVAATCGWHPELTLIHDGTAAAATHAGEAGHMPCAVEATPAVVSTPTLEPTAAVEATKSVAIVLGTALGVGFPAASDLELAALAPDLIIETIAKPEAIGPR